MKDQQISKKVLSIALSAGIGISAASFFHVYAETTSTMTSTTLGSITSDSSSSSSSTDMNFNIIDDIANGLPGSWKLGDEGYTTQETKMLKEISKGLKSFLNT